MWGAYFILGSAHEKMGEIDYAIENFSIVSGVGSHSRQCLAGQGGPVSIRRGSFKAGLEDYEEALKLDGEKQMSRKRRLLRRIDN
jgi:hypothetical protein